MGTYDDKQVVLIVTGVSLRAEEMDRPMGYRLAREVEQRLTGESDWRPVVISDVLYLNEKRLHRHPVISLGGPGVNNLSACLYNELPSVLTIDNVLMIQMDIDLDDQRCCLWGLDHDQTVEALELFLSRGYLDRFLSGVVQNKQQY